MTLAYHCDRDGCDTWINHNADIPSNFIAIYTIDDDEPLAYCCSIDCLMHWAAAHSEPPTIKTDHNDGTAHA